MQNSGWFLNAQKLDQYARHYYDLTTLFPFYECITYPDGGLRTNTTDLSKYLIALIFLCDRYLADKAEIIALLVKYTN